MAISFKIYAEHGFVLSTWVGSISDSDLWPLYQQLVEASQKSLLASRRGGIEASFQVLEILMYSCGLKFGFVSILNQNHFFEIASIQ